MKKRKEKNIVKIWYYFPMPLMFTIMMIVIGFFTLSSKQSLSSLDTISDPNVFYILTVLLLLVWLIGTILSIINSPFIYQKIYKTDLIKKMTNNLKNIFIFMIVITGIVFFITLFISGIQLLITITEYNYILPSFIYSIMIGYTYILAMIYMLFAAKKDKEQIKEIKNNPPRKKKK